MGKEKGKKKRGESSDAAGEKGQKRKPSRRDSTVGCSAETRKCEKRLSSPPIVKKHATRGKKQGKNYQTLSEC